MDTTMEQLYAEMRKFTETQAVQSQMLTQIMQRLDQSAQASIMQSGQIAALVTDVSVIKTEMSLWRSDLNALNSWRADTSNLFIPRREVEALRHEERIKALESDKDEEGEKQVTFMQWLTTNGLTTLFFLIMLIITIYNTVK